MVASRPQAATAFPSFSRQIGFPVSMVLQHGTAGRARTGQILDLLDYATQDNLTVNSRFGNVIVLSRDLCDDVLVTADLHGHRENFQKILDVADMDAHPRRHLILQEVCHGGPKDDEGGCKSHAMLEAVAQIKVRYPGRVHFLLSNHELSEMTDYPISKNGGILLVTFRLGVDNTYGELAPKVMASYKRFIGSCPIAAVLPGGIFISHSTPEQVDRRGFDVSVFHRELTPKDFDIDGPAGRLVWGRDYRPVNADCFADLVQSEILINGHTPCAAGYSVANQRQIILDCCNTPACVVLLPTTGHLNRAEIVQRIQRL